MSDVIKEPKQLKRHTLKFTEPYDWNKIEYDLHDFAIKRLDGSDYDRGSLETIEHEVDKLKNVITKLLVVLADRESLNKKELYEILLGYTPSEGVVDVDYE